MTEQQYTCPSCHKDYTRFTIAEHYGCGVEPLEETKEIEIKEYADGTTATGVAPLPDNSPNEQENVSSEIAKPEPKKRGRKPKVKV